MCRGLFGVVAVLFALEAGPRGFPVHGTRDVPVTDEWWHGLPVQHDLRKLFVLALIASAGGFTSFVAVAPSIVHRVRSRFVIEPEPVARLAERRIEIAPRSLLAPLATPMRFVAIGDSSVEGLDDPDGDGGHRGWANRLADRLAGEYGDVLYANLAVRGRTTRQVRDQQLARAVAMKPDLAAVVAGTNDVLRPNFDPHVIEEDLYIMQRALVDAGATVITLTVPDLTPVMPLARIIRNRVFALDEAIRRACERSGAIPCDLAKFPVSSDPRLLSADRLHANSAGHARITDGLAYALGLPGADMRWSEPFPDPLRPTFGGVVGAELAWLSVHLVPWVWRHLHGRSSGDGVVAKRPELTPVCCGAAGCAGTLPSASVG